MSENGRLMALETLAGHATDQVPVTLFTWGFDYLWKVAGIEPWQLACGDHETWHRAILAEEAALPLDAFAFEQPRKGVETTVARVREVFGPKRCLFGNLDSELLLMRNDPAEIAAAVHAQLHQSGPVAPFILSTGSPLPSNIEPAAVDTMIGTARGS